MTELTEQQVKRATAAAGSVLLRPWAKPLLLLLCLLPLLVLLAAAGLNRLGDDPVTVASQSTGLWSLRFLCLTLAVTPLQNWLKKPHLIRFRRMLGLFVFFYASLHLLVYAGLEMGASLPAIWQDLGLQAFVIVGVLAWLILLLLAATAPNAVIRHLGAVRWRRLHRLTYVAAALAMLHFYWARMGHQDFSEVAFYAFVLAALLMTRLWQH